MTQQTTIYNTYLSVPEMAAYCRCSIRKIYSLTSGRKIAFIKSGGQVLFHKETVDRWLQDQSVATINEIKDLQLRSIKSINSF